MSLWAAVADAMFNSRPVAELSRKTKGGFDPRRAAPKEFPENLSRDGCYKGMSENQIEFLHHLSRAQAELAAATVIADDDIELNMASIGEDRLVDILNNMRGLCQSIKDATREGAE